jgi:hypothetical protein
LFWGVFALYTLVVGVAIFPFHAWLASGKKLVWPGRITGSPDDRIESQPVMPLALRQGWLPLLVGIGLVVLSVVLNT